MPQTSHNIHVKLLLIVYYVYSVNTCLPMTSVTNLSGILTKLVPLSARFYGLWNEPYPDYLTLESLNWTYFNLLCGIIVHVTYFVVWQCSVLDKRRNPLLKIWCISQIVRRCTKHLAHSRNISYLFQSQYSCAQYERRQQSNIFSLG